MTILGTKDFPGWLPDHVAKIKGKIYFSRTLQKYLVDHPEIDKVGIPRFGAGNHDVYEITDEDREKFKDNIAKYWGEPSAPGVEMKPMERIQYKHGG